MGAGAFPAGVGPAGADPLPVPFGATPPRNRTPPAALLFDGASQDFLLDPATGLYREINPVDQQVALALLVNLGSITSAPEVGAPFRSILRITPSTKTEATRMAQDALADLVQQQLIQVVTVEVDVYFEGGFAVAVQYRNLVTQQTPTFSLPQGSFTGM